ncbi:MULTISPECIES: WG repeat-containing protein [Caldisericum]
MGLCNKNKNVVLQASYDNVLPFSEGLAAVDKIYNGDF